MDSAENRVANEVDESTPLLVETSKVKNVRRSLVLRCFLVIIILVCTMMIAFLILNFIRNVDYYVDQCVIVTVNDISFDSINFNGPVIKVQATVDLHYDNISNWLYRNILKVSGSALGTITFIFTDAMQIFAKPANLEVEYLHLADVFPPEIPINLSNNSTNIIDFNTQTKVMSLNVIRFMDYLDSVPEDDVLLDVSGIFNGVVETKLANIPVSNFTFQKQTHFAKDAYLPKFKVVSTEIEPALASGFKVESKVVIESQLPLLLEFGEIEWDVLFHDCNDFSKVGKWSTSPFKLNPGRVAEVEVHGIIDSITSNLTEQCENNHVSPINEAVEEILLKGKLEATIVALSGDSLPPWLIHMLQSRITFPLDLSQYFQISGNPLSVDDFHMVIMSNSTKHDMGLTFTSADDLAVDFVCECLNSSLRIFKGNETLLTGDMTKVDIKNYESTLNLKVEDFQGYVGNPELLGKMINGYLNMNQDIELTLEIQIGYLRLTSLFDQAIILHNLNITKDFIIDQKHKSLLLQLLDLPKAIQRRDDDQRTVLPIISSIKYIGSTENSIKLEAEAKFENDNNYSLSIPDEIGVGVATNSSSIAKVNVDLVRIEKHKNFSISANIDIGPLDTTQLIDFEILSSKFISKTNCTVDVKNITTTNADLNRLILQINLNDVLILPPSDPYLISSTVHILSSTVEVVLFNPIENQNLEVEIYLTTANYGDVVLGQLQAPQKLTVTPGIFHSGKLPIQINNGIGMDILRKSLHGDLQIDLNALFNVKVGNFHAELYYNGQNKNCNIEW
jgi:hypothetical protein